MRQDVPKGQELPRHGGPFIQLCACERDLPADPSWCGSSRTSAPLLPFGAVRADRPRPSLFAFRFPLKRTPPGDPPPSPSIGRGLDEVEKSVTSRCHHSSS